MKMFLRFYIIVALFLFGNVILTPICAQSNLGTQKFGENTYALVEEPARDWFAAQRRCEQLGGDLVGVNSAEENEFVKTLAAGKRVWLGGSRKRNKWSWIDGSPWGFTNFDTQPRNHVVLVAAGKWQGVRFDPLIKTEGFICEWRGTPPSTEFNDPPVEPKPSSPSGVNFFGGGGGRSVTTNRGSSRPSSPAVSTAKRKNPFVKIKTTQGSGVGVVVKTSGQLVVLTGFRHLPKGSEFTIYCGGRSSGVETLALCNDNSLVALVPADPSVIKAGASVLEWFESNEGGLAFDTPIEVHTESSKKNQATLTSIQSYGFKCLTPLPKGTLGAAIEPKSGQLIGLIDSGAGIDGIKRSSGNEEIVVRTPNQNDFTHVRWDRWNKERQVLGQLAANTNSFQSLIAQVDDNVARTIYINDFEKNSNPLSKAAAQLSQQVYGNQSISKPDRAKSFGSFFRMAATLSSRDLSNYQSKHFSGAYRRARFHQIRDKRALLERQFEQYSFNEHLLENLKLRRR